MYVFMEWFDCRFINNIILQTKMNKQNIVYKIVEESFLKIYQIKDIFVDTFTLEQQSS